jgi:uncharacterized protein YcbK (DUF882 family)
MTRKKLSKHFVVEEFDCKDGTPVPRGAEPALVELCEYMLEPLRKKYGSCTVNSGYRHTAYNRSIGGALFSQHIYDQDPRSVAADVRFARGTPKQWARSARWRFRTNRRWNGGSIWKVVANLGRRGGVGLYVVAGFVHVDSGPRRDWSG